MKQVFYGISIALLCCSVSPSDSSVSGSGVPSIEKKPVSLSIVQGDGSTVSLTDGSMYQIAPQDWAISGGWFANPAEVVVVDTRDGSQYPLIITNKATGTSVRAVLMPAENMGSQ